MTNDEIIQAGKEILYAAAIKCNAELEFCNEECDGILDDDEERLSFLASIKVCTFCTDNGEVSTDLVTFQLDYDRATNDFCMIIGEDTEINITYGNVMAGFYFSEIQKSAS